MEHPIDLDHLSEAGQRLTRTVDGLHSRDWSADSLLPGWTRAHVVAHLALNGEALRDVLRGEIDHTQVPMYASQEARDADIEELSGAEPAELRDRLLGSLTTFLDVVQSVPDDVWDRRFERTPGGQSLPLDAIPLMRVREIEIHHADLGLGYTADDWPPAFAETVIGSMVRRLDPDDGFRVAPLDSDRSWDVGAAGADAPVVTGPVAQVAWWLTGRAPGEQVRCSRGDLPPIGAW
ncbi:maleylpyruvate isomerase family mycothiol-dependent enzyme [Nocardioides sp.]|uniref:maleylpyruvate isomerase family mycothiol-dependent enzyme n=1 Tax=Nocardioides sp. TaxID=35761 RepID=UPI002ED572F0